MKVIGLILLLAGVVAALVTATWHKVDINWVLYFISLGVAAVGVIFIRVALHKHRRQETRVEANIAAIKGSMEKILKNAERLEGEKNTIDVYDVHKKIDEMLISDIEDFVEARETISHEYGLSVYADVMSHFSAAERYINRVWCASADGYIDEVKMYIGKALEEFRTTKTHLDAVLK